MATMKDVAREAGVSLGTVSHVLNNTRSVSEEKKKKVLDAIQKLNFSTNLAAKALKTGESKSFGLIIPDITNPYYPELARGVEDAANRQGYSVFLCNNDRGTDKERKYIKILLDKNVDGIILVKSKVDASEIHEIQKKCCVVLVDMDTRLIPDCDIINVDDFNGVYKAMKFLYNHGHRRIAFISGLLESGSSRLRLEAYEKFLEDNHIEKEDSLIKRGSYDWFSGYSCTVALLKCIKPPTAILAANDLMAIGAMKAVRERQLHIPLDISIMGYDDIDMATLCTPQLTTVRQPKYEIGTLSIDLLMKRVSQKHNQVDPYEIKILNTEIIVRQSTGYVKK